MVKINEKIEASLMFASYFETIGFKNGSWEFNYQSKVDSFPKFIELWTHLQHHYIILGGLELININKWNASDDTILLLATTNGVIKGGGEENYKNEYIKVFDLLLDEKRASGINTIETLKLLKQGKSIDTLQSSSSMGGNGAAIRTGPIGLKWYKNIEKVIEESMIASRLTHNYYLGFLGGVVAAVFTAYAMNDIPVWKWIDELIKLYNDKTIHKYFPKNQNINDIDEYFGYWKRYNETRMSNIKYKNNLDTFIYPSNRAEYLMSFHPNQKIKSMILNKQSLTKLNWDWNKLGGTGLDSCIIAYDCLLMSMQTPNSKTIDYNNVVFSLESFVSLIAIHPGDSDSTASIGGMWFGALNGYHNFNTERIKELEFYEELLKVSNKLCK